MIKLFVVAIALITLAMLSPAISRAQTAPIDSSIFWDRLRQTDTLLTQALARSDRVAQLTQIQQMWQNVDQTRLGSDLIDVDLGWLLLPVKAGDDASLHTVQRQVEALLAFEQGAGSSTPVVNSLAALQNILKDPRFQYPTPTASPDSTPDLTPAPARTNPLNGLNFSPELSQTILLLVGIIILAAIGGYAVTVLRVRPYKLALPSLADDPTTPAQAIELATQRAEAQDYRSAIRYLYLSSLLSLSEAGLIDYNPALTNREHLLQIRGKRPLLDALRPVVDAFEKVWYGYAPVDAAYYDRYYQQIEQLRTFFK